MDGDAFVEGVRRRLVPIAPIIEHAINKQLLDIGTTPEMMTVKEAEVFIAKLHNALELFLGPDGAAKAKADMMAEFRKTAPEHFESMSPI